MAATTNLGRADKEASLEKTSPLAAGRCGKGRAAKRQRRERAEAQARCAKANEAVTEMATVKEAAATEAATEVAVAERASEVARPASPAPSLASTIASTRTATSGWSAASRALRRPKERVRLTELQPGERLEGKVTGVQPYGAFIDVKAQKDGLLPLVGPREGEKALTAGQRVAVLYVKHVDAARGRLTLSLDPPRERPTGGGGVRSDSRSSNASGGAESVSTQSSRLSSRLSASTARSGCSSSARARESRAEVRAAAFDVLAAALATVDAATGFWIGGEVVSLAGFGAFVRLAGSEVAAIWDACHDDSGVKRRAVAGGGAAVDGLLHNSELSAAYRAGLIGGAGEAGGIAVGGRVRVRVVEVNVTQQQLRLSLLPPPRASAAPLGDGGATRFRGRFASDATEEADANEEVSSAAKEAVAPKEVDGATLASRLQWMAPVEEPAAAHAALLVVRKARRLPHGKMRLMRLVELPWKDEVV